MREVIFKKASDGNMVATCAEHGYFLIEYCWFRCDQRTDKTRGQDHQQRLAGDNCDRERVHPRAPWCLHCNQFVAVREFALPHRVIYLDDDYDVIGEHLAAAKGHGNCHACQGTGKERS